MFLTVFHRFNPFLERIVPVALFLKSERERIALYKRLTVSNKLKSLMTKEQHERFSLFHKLIALSLTKKWAICSKLMSEFPTLQNTPRKQGADYGYETGQPGSWREIFRLIQSDHQKETVEICRFLMRLWGRMQITATEQKLNKYRLQGHIFTHTKIGQFCFSSSNMCTEEQNKTDECICSSHLQETASYWLYWQPSASHTCSHLSWKMQIFVKHGANKLHNLKKISTLLFFHFFYFSITAQAELSPDSAHKKI